MTAPLAEPAATPPARTTPPGFPALERLFEREDRTQRTDPEVRSGSARGAGMPWALRRAYGGELCIPLRSGQPTLIANLVSTLDGVVALDAEGATGGGEVSGFHQPDRFVMGLLRSLADVVIVGAGTLRAAPTHRWTPRHVHRASADAFATWRRRAGVRDPEPTTIIVTRGGEVDPAHPGLADPAVPVVIVASPEGARRLATSAFGPHVRVVVDRSPDLPGVALRVAAADLGARVVLCEGGPHVLAELVAERRVDELFLTLAPQLVGRATGVERLALIEGRAFDPGTAPWVDLVSVTRSIDHLFLRYRFEPQPRN